MFKGKKFFFLILLCYLSVSVTNGQKFNKGLIFSNKGDTARGFVLLPADYMPAHNCFFKPAANDNVVILSAADITGFQTAGQTYIATRVRINNKDSVLFTRRIFKGIHELRYFQIRNAKHFIIVRPDSSLFAIKYPPDLKPAEVLSGVTSDKKFLQQADSIFPDTPDLPEYQKGAKPDLNSILTLFRQYHNPPYTKATGGAPGNALQKEYRKGFIITNTKDTLDGFLANNLEKTFYRTCIFTPDRNENALQILPGEITGFGSFRKNKLFVPAKLISPTKDSSVFVRLLLEGSVDLLYYNLDGTNHYLLRDVRGGIHQVSYSPVMNKQDYLRGLNPAGKFLKQADSIFSILNIPYKDVKPEPRSMIRVLEDYHEIMSYPFSKYYGISMRMALSFVAGARFEKYLYETTNDGYRSYSDPAPYIGLYLTMFNRMGKLGLLLRNTVGYHNDNYSYKQQFNDYTWFRQTSIKSFADNLEAGIIFRPVRKSVINPFIEAGGTGRYYFKSRYDNYAEENYSDQYVFSYHDNDILNSYVFFGGFARVGLTRAIRPNNSISLSCGYSYLMSTGPEKIHSAELSVIYNFLRK